jgi:hypothetical protein
MEISRTLAYSGQAQLAGKQQLTLREAIKQCNKHLASRGMEHLSEKEKDHFKETFDREYEIERYAREEAY